MSDITNSMRDVENLANTTYDSNNKKVLFAEDWNDLKTLISSILAVINSGGSLATVISNLASHIANTSNPHSVTKSQVGLGNVDNTADSSKHVASANTLYTARAINGVNFDGSAPISIYGLDKRISSSSNPSSVTPTPASYDVTTVTALAQTLTINAMTGSPANSKPHLLKIKDNGTSRTLTWDSSYIGMGVALPTATTVGKLMSFGLIYNSDLTKTEVYQAIQV